MPSIYHPLLPVPERPKTFHSAHRSLDPKHVGYRLEVGDPEFVYSVGSIGGSNAGREFGSDLTCGERWDLVECLKAL